MARQIFGDIALNNGLLPDDSKPISEPTFTFYQVYSMAFTWQQFQNK